MSIVKYGMTRAAGEEDGGEEEEEEDVEEDEEEERKREVTLEDNDASVDDKREAAEADEEAVVVIGGEDEVYCAGDDADADAGEAREGEDDVTTADVDRVMALLAVRVSGVDTDLISRGKGLADSELAVTSVSSSVMPTEEADVEDVELCEDDVSDTVGDAGRKRKLDGATRCGGTEWERCKSVILADAERRRGVRGVADISRPPFPSVTSGCCGGSEGDDVMAGGRGNAVIEASMLIPGRTRSMQTTDVETRYDATAMHAVAAIDCCCHDTGDMRPLVTSVRE